MTARSRFEDRHGGISVTALVKDRIATPYQNTCTPLKTPDAHVIVQTTVPAFNFSVGNAPSVSSFSLQRLHLVGRAGVLDLVRSRHQVRCVQRLDGQRVLTTICKGGGRRCCSSVAERATGTSTASSSSRDHEKQYAKLSRAPQRSTWTFALTPSSITCILSIPRSDTARYGLASVVICGLETVICAASEENLSIEYLMSIRTSERKLKIGTFRR